MYTQCKLQYETTKTEECRYDTVWIPTKFAIVGQRIILTKPLKRYAKVLETYNHRDKVERKLWNNNI